MLGGGGRSIANLGLRGCGVPRPIERRDAEHRNSPVGLPRYCEADRVARQAGKVLHPQNCSPILLPLALRRSTIADPQRGQLISPGIGIGALITLSASRLLIDSPRRIRAVSAPPVISSMLRPSARAFASAKNFPELTTKPPVAPCAAITP